MDLKKKCGTIAIVGQSNVGKSTLLNYFVGTKLSITSRKAQTTRYQLLGICTDNDTIKKYLIEEHRKEKISLEQSINQF